MNEIDSPLKPSSPIDLHSRVTSTGSMIIDEDDTGSVIHERVTSSSSVVYDDPTSSSTSLRTNVTSVTTEMSSASSGLRVNLRSPRNQLLAQHGRNDSKMSVASSVASMSVRYIFFLWCFPSLVFP